MALTTVDDFTALNEQIAALAEAGVPLDVSLGGGGQPAAKDLERIRTTVLRRVRRGETLEQALQGDDDDVPPSYRSLLQVAAKAGNVSAALEEASRVAAAVDDSRFTLASAFVYPLIVCVLAYLGLIGFCVFLVPVWEGMYASADREPGQGLRILQALRETMPMWIAIPPLVLLVLFSIWHRSRSRRGTMGVRSEGLFAGLPGIRRTLFQERCARFAVSLQELMAAGTPFGEALRIAGDASGDPDLRSGAHLLSSDVECGVMPGDAGSRAVLFPPFLRWSLWDAEETVGRSRALSIAARMYREAAERRNERLRALAPVVTLLLLGGTVTLLYGLALFLPFSQMLRAISLPN